MYKITQEDREAAWKYRPSCYKVDDYTNWMAGKYDLVTAVIGGFAAHRLAHTQQSDTPVATDVAALVEALREVISATCDYLPPDGISEQECLNRVIGATDNLKVIAALAPFTKG